MGRKRKFGTKDIVYIGILSAMLVIATSIKVPFGPGGSMVHMGSAAIFLSGILFGGVYAGAAGALGSAFFDLLMGYSPYTVWSFVIKGIAGLIVGVVAKGLWPESGNYYARGNKWYLPAFFGCILSAAWTLGGYIVAWAQVLGSWAVALNNAPSSLMTSGVGMVVSFILAPKLRKVLQR